MGIAGILAINAGLCAADRGGAPATNGFGFTGPEIYPIENLISNLRVADLDGDGLNDLIVVNNARSRINLLYNQTGKTNRSASLTRPTKRELNELPPGARFRIDSIASEKRISSLVVADLNGDGRPDLAYYGEPKELVLQYNQGSNGWSSPKRWPLDDGQLGPNCLWAGDLDGDGLVDLALLADNNVYVLLQQKDHTLGEPRKIPLSGAVKSIQVVDVDGDGLKDLLLVNWEDRNPFRFRLQKKGGDLGPEIYFPSPPIRAYTVDNLEEIQKIQVITISQNSGRAQISEFRRKPAEPLAGAFLEGQFNLLPLSKSEKARRGQAWADVNGDGRADLLVAEPESGQLSIYFQQVDGTLSSPKAYSTLAGISELAVADWNGDGKQQIFMLSPDERQLGVTHLDEHQGLPFPTLIPLEGKPLTFAVGELKPGAKPVLAILLDQDGKHSLLLRWADGKTKTQKLSGGFKSNPSVMAFHDADQDGLNDLVILTPYERVKVLRQTTGGDFEELELSSPGGEVEQPWLCRVDVDGDGKPELLLNQKNFLRAVVLKSDKSETATDQGNWAFSVKEQINGTSSNSRLVAAAAVPNGTNRVPSLFVLDAERKSLTLCERDKSGVWQVTRNIALPVSDFSSLQPVRLSRANDAPGAAPNGVAMFSINSIGWLALDGQVWDLAELDGYETPIKDGHLSDVVCGDLNNDGRKDLVFLETQKNYLDLVIFDSSHKLTPANRWQVFEERTFRNRRSEFPEPREAAVADVTGDGKNDLIVLVHDRILVYPQE